MWNGGRFSTDHNFQWIRPTGEWNICGLGQIYGCPCPVLLDCTPTTNQKSSIGISHHCIICNDELGTYLGDAPHKTPQIILPLPPHQKSPYPSHSLTPVGKIHYVLNSDHYPVRSDSIPSNLLVEHDFIHPQFRLMLEITEGISAPKLWRIFKLPVVIIS